MKNRGFTLIELVATVVIMGMLLLIVVPATSRLMNQNEQKKYKTYYDILEGAIEKYARTRRDDIGGVTGTGCVEDKTISYLIEKEYINTFNEEEGVRCGSPSEFNVTELARAGIENPSQYIDIRIRNNKGKITTEFSMICLKDNAKKAEYTKLVKKGDATCERYVAEVQNSLLSEISDSTGLNYINVLPESDNNYYVDGAVVNNYVWYSGKMWRIIGYNTLDRTIKMVMDENVSLLTYNGSNSDYRASNINVWLNSVFLNTLRNSNKFLIEGEWNYTTVSDSTKPARTLTTSAKVGMLNYYEYSKVRDSLTGGSAFWLLSKYDENNAWYINASKVASNSVVSEFMGVRPAVVLRANVTFIQGGNGTSTNPYRLTGDTSGSVGNTIASRYVGEYVSLGGIMYRILNIEESYTRLISVNTISDLSSCEIAEDKIIFHDTDTIYSANTEIGKCLRNWAGSVPLNVEETLHLSDKLVKGDFCREAVLNTEFQTGSCKPTSTGGLSNIINEEIAIPKIGDMFTIESDEEYWTLSNTGENTNQVYVVETDGTVDIKTLELDSTIKSRIRPVIVISNTNTIASGEGTLNSPYILN